MALALSNKALADACIFDGSTVKCLRPGVRLFDGSLSAADYGVTRILTGADDPSAIAKFAERGSLYLRSSTAGHSTYQKQDDGTTTNWSALGGGSGSGEANTASNLGTGSQVFASKVGVDLQFRSFLGGGSTVVSQGANEITVTSPAAENITGANTGSGIGIFLDKIASVLRFKTIEAGTNVTLSESNSTITINATSSGEANTASNVGGAAGVFKQKSGVDLQLRSIRAGQSTSVTQDTDTITVATNPAIGEVNTIRNRGSGIGLSLDKIGAEHQLATIAASGSTSVAFANSTVTVSSSSPMDSTCQNLGSGAGLCNGNTGANLQFKTVAAGGSTSLAVASNTATFSIPSLPLPDEVLQSGRSGGQRVTGDTTSGGSLYLDSTAHATKGKIKFGTGSWYDQSIDQLYLGHSPSVSLSANQQDLRSVFNFTYASGIPLIPIIDHWSQEVNYTVKSGATLSLAEAMDAKYLNTNVLSGTILDTTFAFSRFHRNSGSGNVVEHEVQATGLTSNRFAGQATVTRNATGTADTWSVTLPYTTADATYSAWCTGHDEPVFQIIHAPAPPRTYRVTAYCTVFTRSTTAMSGHISYTFFDTTTSVEVVTCDTLNGCLDALDPTRDSYIEFAGTLGAIDWGIRDYR